MKDIERLSSQIEKTNIYKLSFQVCLPIRNAKLLSIVNCIQLKEMT